MAWFLLPRRDIPVVLILGLALRAVSELLFDVRWTNSLASSALHLLWVLLMICKLGVSLLYGSYASKLSLCVSRAIVGFLTAESLGVLLSKSGICQKQYIFLIKFSSFNTPSPFYSFTQEPCFFLE